MSCSCSSALSLAGYWASIRCRECGGHHLPGPHFLTGLQSVCQGRGSTSPRPSRRAPVSRGNRLLASTHTVYARWPLSAKPWPVPRLQYDWRRWGSTPLWVPLEKGDIWGGGRCAAARGFERRAQPCMGPSYPPVSRTTGRIFRFVLRMWGSIRARTARATRCAHGRVRLVGCGGGCEGRGRVARVLVL